MSEQPRDLNTHPMQPVPVDNGFSALLSALASVALAASDASDHGGFKRALAYREAVKRIADRWHAGEASPTRTGKERVA